MFFSDMDKDIKNPHTKIIMENVLDITEALEIVNGGDIPLMGLWLLLIFLFLAGLMSLVFRRLHFSYTIGLVLVGIFCSWISQVLKLPVVPDIHLTENLTLYVFLPALIYAATTTMDLKVLRKSLVPVLLLAVPGVIIAALLTGMMTWALTPLGLGAAMIFGALISTTDPIAVIATFKEVNAPERITMLVDGESLFNDAATIMMFVLVTGLVSSGASITSGMLLKTALQFVWIFLGGVAVGLVVGIIGCLLIKASHKLGYDRRVFRVLFSIVVAYGSFMIAQSLLNISGVMATISAGFVMSYWIKKQEGEKSMEHFTDFWNVIAFLGNSLIFLFLGLTERYLVQQNYILLYLVPSLAAVLAVLAARVIMVQGMSALSGILPGQEKISMKYRTVMTWGGIRGAIPIALAVSLKSSDFGPLAPGLGDEFRSMVILFTVAVVIFTLVVQGLTMQPLMKRCGITGDAEH